MRHLTLGVMAAAIAGCAQSSPMHIQVVDASARFPDLTPATPDSLYLNNNGGDVQLRFGTTIGNVGSGPMRITATIEGDQTVATQEIVDSDGTLLATRPAGRFVYHPDHHHTHVDNIAVYELRQGDQNGAVAAQAKKVSYCLEDSVQYSSSWMPRMYPKCSPTLQGISPGWADVYANNVPDQFLSVSNLQAGQYALVVTVDPNRMFADSNYGNNSAWVRIYLDPSNWRLDRLD